MSIQYNIPETGDSGTLPIDKQIYTLDPVTQQPIYLRPLENGLGMEIEHAIVSNRFFTIFGRGNVADWLGLVEVVGPGKDINFPGIAVRTF